MRHPRSYRCTQIQDYILPLVFLKRLSDVFDDEVKRLAMDFGSEAMASNLPGRIMDWCASLSRAGPLVTDRHPDKGTRRIPHRRRSCC